MTMRLGIALLVCAWSGCVWADEDSLEVRGDFVLWRGGEKVSALDEHCGDLGYRANLVHVGSGRDFAVVEGRYCFYVWNAGSERLTGPFAPAFEGEASDSQSGMLVSMQVLEGGRLLVGGQVDAGPFAYSLRHVGSPEPLVVWGRWGDAVLYAWPVVDHGTYTLVVVRGLWEVEASVPVKGLSVSRESLREVGPFMVLEQTLSADSKRAVVLDMRTGARVELPRASKAWSAEELDVHLEGLD